MADEKTEPAPVPEPELDTEDLDQVSGGALDAFIKLEGQKQG